MRNAFETFADGEPPDLWLMLGDNAYYDGTDAQYQAAVFEMYRRQLSASVLWPSLGNHDTHSVDPVAETGPYFDSFTLPRSGEAGGIPSETEKYYSFDYGPIHFVALDSCLSSRSPSGPMLSWLEQDLAASSADWLVAFWHHSPYTKGSHDSDTEGTLIEMRENALPILEEYGVDLVLGGHSHGYERSFLLDSHYGLSDSLVPAMILDGGDGRPDGDGAYVKPSAGLAPHEGTVYVVAGSSGKLTSGPLDHPAMFHSELTLGSLILDVNGPDLAVTFLTANGVVADSFVLAKPGLPLFADGFESGDASAWVARGP